MSHMCEKPTMRLSFVAEWYQEEAAIIRYFIITFYTGDCSLEVFDQRSNKLFLKRRKMPELTESDFFVGSKLNIFGRQFDLVSYADEFTKETLAKFRKKSFVLIKYSIVQRMGDVMKAVIDSNFAINKATMVLFNADLVKKFIAIKDKGSAESSSLLMSHLLAGPAVGMEVIADNAVEKIKYCYDRSGKCNQTDWNTGPLMQLMERTEMRNGITVSHSDEEAERDLEFFFGGENPLLRPLTLKNTTLCIVKPHCIKEGNMGNVLNAITQNGFIVTAMRMNHLERGNCEEFYEVYRGIVPDYIPMVTQLSSGGSLALEVQCTDPEKNTYSEFRSLCGPQDPEIAKLLRPYSLRAQFGHTKTLNAVHCTDLPDDTNLELQYVFQIIE